MFHSIQPRIIDKIQKYQESRYIGAPEAIWRIFQFDISKMHPSVECLQIHLPGGQSILYEEGNEIEALVRAQTARTKLTSYFNTVTSEIEQPLTPPVLGRDPVTAVSYPSAPQLKYIDFPEFYTWNDSSKAWKRRVKPLRSDTIG